MHRSIWRRLRHLVLGVVALLPVVTPLTLASPSPTYAQSATGDQKIAPPLLADISADPLRMWPVIVEMQPLSAPFAQGVNVILAQQALSILSTYGKPVSGLSLVNGAAGWANATGIRAMSLLPQVAAVHEDSKVQPTRPSTGAPSYPAPKLTSLYPQEIQAPPVWQQGRTGLGVTVAVLDSGVAQSADLAANRVVAAVSFAGARDPNYMDKGGHGTHVAGTIAGNGAASAGQYVGIAPKANIVDVKVLDDRGNGRVSSVLRGLEWVVAHQAQYNIRVVNLSLGAPALVPYQTDPLAAGVEIAWKRGLVVVAAAGNGGPNSGTVVSPGIDPYVITVGSTDDRATLSTSDDLLAWFSAWGTPTGSTPKPDVIAPGRRVVSLRVPGSTLDTMYPDHVVTASNGATYFRLTGTSMSTAVVSGMVALLLERYPTLTPDQVKRVLTMTSQPFGQSSTQPPAGAAGAGLVDAYAAASTPLPGASRQGARPSSTLARSLYSVLYGLPLVWKDPNYLGQPWSSLTWATLNWDNIAWDNIAWDNIAWDNIAWDNIAWDNIAWDNIAWDNIAWDSFGFD